jgi:hypothetical protein
LARLGRARRSANAENAWRECSAKGVDPPDGYDAIFMKRYKLFMLFAVRAFLPIGSRKGRRGRRQDAAKPRDLSGEDHAMA